MKIDKRALKLSFYFLFILIIMKIVPDPNKLYLLYPTVVVCEYSSTETLKSFKNRSFGFLKGGIFGLILASYIGISPLTVMITLVIIVLLSEHIGADFFIPTLTTFLPIVIKPIHMQYFATKVPRYMIIMLVCIIIDYLVDRVFKLPKEKIHL